MLGVALCFYLVGSPVFSFVNGVLGLPVSWEILVVGLFMGLLPRRERLMLYAALIIVTVFNVAVGYPRLVLEVETAINGARLVGGVKFDLPVEVNSASSNPFLGFMFSEILPIILLVLAFHYRREVYDYVKNHILLFAATMFLSVPSALFFTILLVFSSNGVNYTLESAFIIFRDTIVAFLIFSELWVALCGPWIVCLLFARMGIYRRIPHVIETH